MNNKQAYREKFIKLKEVFQKHDPLNYFAMYDSERFGKDLYSYEVTTLLEKQGQFINDENIEQFIIARLKSKETVNLEAIKSASIEIMAVLNGF